MRRFVRTVTIAVVATLALAPTLRAQAVLQNDSLRVELIGLRRWTVPMIQDSLRRHAPQASLLSHACAAALRAIGFADASAVYYAPGTGGGTQEYVVVSVIEPQDSALVRWRAPFRDTLPAEATAREVATLLARQPRAVQQMLRRPALLLSTATLAPTDSFLAPALPLRAFLDARRAATVRQRAYRTLSHDGDEANRVAATILLANFADRDRTWWTLVDGLRDRATPVHVAATQLLHGLTADRPRRVDWAPAASSVRAVLDGTDLFAHDALLAALAATRVSPRLARPLLAGGGHLVLAKLRSSAPRERALARRFLVQIAGRDLGDEPARWEAWIAALDASPRVGGQRVGGQRVGGQRVGSPPQRISLVAAKPSRS
jgi:hypothetical protein